MKASMSIDEAIGEASQIAKSLHGRRVNNDPRSKLACVCFATAQQHHNAILILLSHQPPLHATAFALLRLLVESTIRGLWLSHVATNAQVEEYPTKGTKLDMASMMLALDKVTGLNTHESIYKSKWKILSSYTHTGELQVQRWMTTTDVESDYSNADVQELVHLSSLTARLASQAVIAISTLS